MGAKSEELHPEVPAGCCSSGDRAPTAEQPDSCAVEPRPDGPECKAAGTFTVQGAVEGGIFRPRLHATPLSHRHVTGHDDSWEQRDTASSAPSTLV